MIPSIEILTTRRCEVCHRAPCVIVGVVPGVGESCAYCRDCFQANAHPWHVLIGNTACIGGLAHASGWWLAMVDATCLRLGRSREDFTVDVATAMREGGW